MEGFRASSKLAMPVRSRSPAPRWPCPRRGRPGQGHRRSAGGRVRHARHHPASASRRRRPTARRGPCPTETDPVTRPRNHVRPFSALQAHPPTAPQEPRSTVPRTMKGRKVHQEATKAPFIAIQQTVGVPDQPPRAPARLVVAYGAQPAHDLLRAQAALFHGVPLDRVVLGHACPRCGSEQHGRPYVLPTATLRAPGARQPRSRRRPLGGRPHRRRPGRSRRRGRGRGRLRGLRRRRPAPAASARRPRRTRPERGCARRRCSRRTGSDSLSTRARCGSTTTGWCRGTRAISHQVRSGCATSSYPATSSPSLSSRAPMGTSRGCRPR